MALYGILNGNLTKSFFYGNFMYATQIFLTQTFFFRVEVIPEA